jgi:hypothetical protein
MFNIPKLPEHWQSFFLSIFFASLFGITTDSLPAYVDFQLLSIIYISFLYLIHCGERWNWHLYEKKAILQFLRKK